MNIMQFMHNRTDKFITQLRHARDARRTT